MEHQIHLLQTTYVWITDAVLMDPSAMPLARYYQLVRVAAERSYEQTRERREEMLWMATMISLASWNPSELAKQGERLREQQPFQENKTSSNDHAGALAVASKIIARREAARNRVASN